MYLVLVAKPDKSVRICGDFKVTINSQLITDRYPLPNIQEVIVEISGSEYFSKLDMSHAYQQIKVEKASQKYLTLSTHKGLFECVRLMYGVASAPGIFQRIIERILQGLDGVVCYLDDVLIGGKSLAEHLKRI